jgi:nucleoside-diphosphate-sugar epimerase
MNIAITGANGHLGIRLIRCLNDNHTVKAIVRSDRAKQALLSEFPALDVVVVNYVEADELAAALSACEQVIHLVGIIKESKAATFYDAHENSCRSLATAAERSGVKRIVYLNIIGAAVQSKNACLQSRGQAEAILAASAVPVSILRIPMVLGEGDYASMALKKNSNANRAFTFRAGSLEQPIYAEDVVDAVSAIVARPTHGEWDLAGSESLSRRDLIQRAASLFNNHPKVISLPISLGLTLAFFLEFLSRPPVTRAMLGVLDHDDQVDVKPACDELGLTLTSLDETLKKVLT